jgi:hypothetical protein
MDERISKALELIAEYGWIDGAHHKQWVLDQAARILTGCPAEVRQFTDYRGQPYSAEVLGESPEYLAWRGSADGWDEGIAP